MSKKINDGLTRNQRWYRGHITVTRSGSRQRVRKWRAENIKRARKQTRNSYHRNRLKRLEEKKIYYQEVEKPRSKTQEGRLADRLKKQKRRTLTKMDTITKSDWMNICQKYDNCCAYCNGKVPLELDHIIPITKGGLHIVENIVPACKSCNSRKGNRDATEVFPDWRRR